MEEAIEKMNFYGKRRQPFLFILNFDASEAIIQRLDDKRVDLLFSVNGIGNARKGQGKPPSGIVFRKFPPSFESYASAFSLVLESLNRGDSYLLNLTFPTRIETSLSLKDFFFLTHAKYKLYVPGRFVVFSPETFLQISDGIIRSHPMKGTIDASVEDAMEKILNDPKELAEHVTIVDLIRNDMSRVAHHVTVERFRYIEHVRTNQKNLLQVSSEIRGCLDETYCENIGDIIFSFLPAGSVTGAPKSKTVEIIRRIESYDRGFYTGVFGVFNGKNLDSGVMIRFIEKIGDEYYYKSGGGITVFSDVNKEYRELIDKVYAPIAGNAEDMERQAVQHSFS